MSIAGIDEAGRGPGAGPVVAASVILPENFLEICPDEIKENIFDSKKVSEKNREIVFDWIYEYCDVGVGECSNIEIDTIGIKKATHKAMQLSIKNLQHKPKKLLIDGNDNFIFEIENECVVKGDEKHQEISAASIIAKVTRDRKMCEYAKKYPKYGFETHKGYLTKKHIEAIEQYGVCEIHRTSYEPIPKILYQQQLF